MWTQLVSLYSTIYSTNTSTNTNTNTNANTNTNTETTAVGTGTRVHSWNTAVNSLCCERKSTVHCAFMPGDLMHCALCTLCTVQCAFFPGDLMRGVPPLCFCHAHFHLAPQYFTNINFKDFFQKNLLCVAGVIWLEEQTECRKYSMYVCSQQFDHGGVMCLTF